MAADPRLSKLVFVVFADDWGRHPSSCQHLFRRIVPHAQVLWVNTIGLRVPRLNVHDIARSVDSTLSATQTPLASSTESNSRAISLRRISANGRSPQCGST